MTLPDWLRTLLDPTWRDDELLARDEAELEELRRRDEEELGFLPHNVIRLSAFRRRQQSSGRSR